MVRQKKNSTDDLVEEINDARYFDYFRAVKRLCLSLGEDERNGRERECSLLETKWELEISMKRRESVLFAADNFILIFDRQDTRSAQVSIRRIYAP